MPVANVYYDEFVEGLPSLEGKCIAITGTTSGTGFWCATAAVKKGAAAVLLCNRASSRATDADAQIFAAAEGTKTAVSSVVCDLMSLDSVRSAAQEVNKIAGKHGGLDILACNAGVMAMPDDRTVDGYDVQMQVNHLSHFLLSALVMPSLESAAKKRGEARCVTHSSGARFFGLGKLPFGATFEKCEPGTLGGNAGTLATMNFLGGQMVRYCHSKAANAVFAMALHEKLAATGSAVKAVTCEPGLAETALFAKGFNVATEKPINPGIKAQALKAFSCFRLMQSGPDGAMPLMQACFGADVASGDMYCPKHQAPVPTGKGPKLLYNKGLPQKTVAAGVPVFGPKDKKEKLTCDDAAKTTLWAKSEAAVGAFTIPADPTGCL